MRVVCTRILWPILRTPGHRVVVDLLWEPADLWQGIYLRPYVSTARRRCLTLYLCLLPCLPLRINLVLWQTWRTWEQLADESDDE